MTCSKRAHSFPSLIDGPYRLNIGFEQVRDNERRRYIVRSNSFGMSYSAYYDSVERRVKCRRKTMVWMQ